jgi:carotenoid cleavage dioxygenase-like enzyme
MLGIAATGRQGRKFFDQLVLADWRRPRPASVYQAPPLHYLAGEPVFVGDPDNPTDAVVLCQLFDAARAASGFVLFDAFDPAGGPVATIRLRSPVHLGFHATFRADDAAPTVTRLPGGSPHA